MAPPTSFDNGLNGTTPHVSGEPPVVISLNQETNKNEVEAPSNNEGSNGGWSNVATAPIAQSHNVPGNVPSPTPGDRVTRSTGRTKRRHTIDVFAVLKSSHESLIECL